MLERNFNQIQILNFVRRWFPLCGSKYYFDKCKWFHVQMFKEIDVIFVAFVGTFACSNGKPSAEFVASG